VHKTCKLSVTAAVVFIALLIVRRYGQTLLSLVAKSKHFVLLVNKKLY
jgi:hypothetical protein